MPFIIIEDSSLQIAVVVTATILKKKKKTHGGTKSKEGQCKNQSVILWDNGLKPYIPVIYALAVFVISDRKLCH